MKACRRDAGIASFGPRAASAHIMDTGRLRAAPAVACLPNWTTVCRSQPPSVPCAPTAYDGTGRARPWTSAVPTEYLFGGGTGQRRQVEPPDNAC